MLLNLYWTFVFYSRCLSFIIVVTAIGCGYFVFDYVQKWVYYLFIDKKKINLSKSKKS